MTPRDLYMWPARNALLRWTLWMLAAALFVAAEAAWAQTTFEAWYDDAIDGNDAALHGRLLEERRAFQERVAVEPLEALLEELRDEAAALAPSDDPERSRVGDSTNVQRLVAMLDRLARDIRQARQRIEAELRQPATRSEPERIASNIVNQGPIPNPFGGMGQVTAGPNAGAYVIAEGAAEEIIVPPDSTSTVDPEIWRIGAIAEAIIGTANLPLMEATHSVIEEARDQWRLFMDNVAADQFFWETIINGWAARRAPRLAGTLTTPPKLQLRAIHPTPVVAYSSEHGTEADLRLAVEVLGLRRFANNYQPRDGLSLIAIVPNDSDQDTGLGLLFTRKRFSLGFARQKYDGGEDVTSIILGLDLAAELQNEQGGLGLEVSKKLDCVRARVAAGVDVPDANLDVGALCGD